MYSLVDPVIDYICKELRLFYLTCKYNYGTFYNVMYGVSVMLCFHIGVYMYAVQNVMQKAIPAGMLCAT